MDFRNCPSCKASVLEDDAEDCPFCGASMSGKPKPASAKPSAAAAPAKPAQNQKKSSPAVPAASVAGTKTPAPKSSAKPAKDESADPFDIDNVAVRSASAVSPRPGKGRTIEVTCPMCETKGYITEKQAGRDVKCCNPQCMVPVFKAPAPARKDEGPVQEKGMFASTLTVAGLVIAAVVGGALYVFVLKGPEDRPKDLVGPTAKTQTEEEKKQATTQIIPDSGEIKTAEEKPPANLQELEKQALPLIAKESQSRDHTRSQLFTKQLAAEAFAVRNNAAGAREQLASLKSIGGNRGAYEVEPLVRIGWLELKAGKRDVALATATTALKSSAQLSMVGREAVDAATSLAALLVALDRREDAAKLLREIPSDDRARASAIRAVALDTGTFNVGQAASMSFLYGNPDTAFASAAFQSALRSGPAPVIPWAQSGWNAAVQDASLAACTAATAWQAKTKGEAGVPAGLEDAFKAGTPATQIRMLAAVAEIDLLRGDQAAALATLTKAETLVAGLMPGPAMPLPELKEIYNSEGKPFAGLPDPYPALTTALAVGDVADLQMRTGKVDAGWTTLQKSLAYLRSATPSASAVQALIDQSEKQQGEMQERLRTALKLPNDRPKLFLALSRYRKQCEALHGVSEQRLEMAASLLDRAAERGALAQVIEYVVEREKAAGNDRESYRKLPLTGHLLFAAQQAGKTDLAASLTNAGEEKISIPDNVVGLAQAKEAFLAGNPEGAAESLRGVYGNPKLERWMTDVRVLAAVTGKLESQKAFDFAHRLRDPLIREDALRLMAARSVQEKTWAGVWKVMNETSSLTHTDRAAILIGFLEAITAAG